MLEDTVLSRFFSEDGVNSYLNDLIRTICSIVDKNFGNISDQNQKSVDFVSRWLLLTDDNAQTIPPDCSNHSIWRLAHVHTLLEYEQSDLLSVYSACQIVELFESVPSLTNQDLKENQLSYSIKTMRKNQSSRFEELKKLFKLMFNQLWKNLCAICSNNDDSYQWVRLYNFSSTYYPSSKILNVIQLEKNSKAQIEFMRLAYLIFLNEKTPDAKKLISILLNDTKLIDENNDERLDWHEMLPNVINSIQKYFESQNADVSTLIIDLSQWIISIFKMSIEKPEKIGFLLKYLNQPSCPLSLSMKQFLFDELMNLSIDLKENQIEQARKQIDCIDRIKFLLPIIFECVSLADTNQIYRLPYHPSVAANVDQEMHHQILLDLFFFHLKRHSNNEPISYKLINKILLPSEPLKINNKDLQPVAEDFFRRLKDHFSIEWTAQLVCEIELNENNRESFEDIMKKMIEDHLVFDKESTQLSLNLQLFLSTIILKRSWSYLLNLLRSDHIQHCDNNWANALYSHLDGDQMVRNMKYVSEYHQVQFTLSKNTSLSAFPNLHQPYDEISKVIDDCIKNDNQDEKWKILFDWIQTTQNADPYLVTLKEIKILLLLKIYYNYYCDNRLSLLDGLLELIQNRLEPSTEELIVLRALLQPKQYMIGYANEETADDENFLNKLFKSDCNSEDELVIRHVLVNLMAMILMGGEQNFLWTFAFKPSTLENTYGK